MFTASRRYWVILPALALLVASLNCTVDFGGTSSTIEQTQTAMAILQTNMAIQSSGAQATGTAMQNNANQTATAQAIPPTPIPTLPPPPPPVVQPTPIPNPVGQITPQMPTSPPPAADFETWMKTASILVYEDIVTDPSEYQYVKRTLEAMGLQYQWDGNAIGRLKSHMLGNGPNGKPWDLVILAIETRGSVSGEYFDYLNDVLNQGTAVILEAWHLDAVSEGAISPILTKCGVTVYPYYVGEGGTVNDVVVWPLPNSSQHPLMLEPNSGMTFTKARDKWLSSFDLGSQMALTGNGDAQLLLGTNAQEPYQDGTLAVCMNGQFILQTFSSHSFPYNTMYPLWENYIYNALRTRLASQS